ncbi:SDR family oxidoreductase [Stigmatella erecta]|uniref:3-oxoacyl-[acyl-carrier protein] reductase n=1 Tax=Stigmatella erecta TaxID=83460 RepID=A0A1I0K2D6_9BACT|nr:SDR family oxidoreductase [Stigmatella erecta]SEU16803.1 3-oxoacyl-[acyl-carrier protein] reductase [Stigmatella erecta]
MSNKTRVAIVTGASRGIGKAAALRLARDGMSVVVNYAGNATEAGKTVAAIQEAGGRAFAVQADVADETAVAALFDATVREFGGVDAVVNSAGIMRLGLLAEFSLSDFDQIHRTNVRGTFVVAQQAARHVRSGGAIINLSTSVERQALPTYAAYAASKGAVEAMSLILARELRGRDITVNAVAPGPVETEFFLSGKDPATVERIAKLNPMERLGQPNDIAEVISFLAGPARWINGQVLYVNGGMN